MALLDKFVRDNTIERFGPVRSVRANADFGLVLEIAFEGLQRSARHKSGNHREAVGEDFHARFSATGRRYLYRIINRRPPLTLDAGRAWHRAPALAVATAAD